MERGLTLISLMVAVALSGVLAVAGTRLVVNQMTALRVMELRDKGDSIFKFYSNLLHDDKVWWCTLYDGKPANTTPNTALRNCALKGSCSTSEEMRLMGPNCTIKFKANGERDFSTGNFTVGTEFIPPGSGKFLKDSVTENVSNGWWNVKVTWEHRGSAAVDLVLTQDFIKANWQTAPAGEKRYLPKLDYPRELRVRRSTNYVPSNTDTGSAVTAINLHTASRTVNRHTSPLVDTTTSGLGNCHDRVGRKGGVVKSTTDCSGNRVAVKPTNCGAQNSVIDRIGLGTDVTAANNVKCALDGRGKMVQYGACPGLIQRDTCSVAGKTFYSPARFEYYSSYRGEYGYGDSYYDYNQWRWRWEWITSPRPWVAQSAIARISPSGGLECVGLPSWPAAQQGPKGRRGAPGGGPQGLPGPAWNETCR